MNKYGANIRRREKKEEKGSHLVKVICPFQSYGLYFLIQLHLFTEHTAKLGTSFQPKIFIQMQYALVYLLLSQCRDFDTFQLQLNSLNANRWCRFILQKVFSQQQKFEELTPLKENQG